MGSNKKQLLGSTDWYTNTHSMYKFQSLYTYCKIWISSEVSRVREGAFCDHHDATSAFQREVLRCGRQGPQSSLWDGVQCAGGLLRMVLGTNTVRDTGKGAGVARGSGEPQFRPEDEISLGQLRGPAARMDLSVSLGWRWPCLPSHVNHLLDMDCPRKSVALEPQTLQSK